MAVRDKQILWSFTILLAGAVSQTVNYPAAVCAVKGSTVSLLCSFTPLQSVRRDGRDVQIEIIRVRWCQNHLICQGDTPSVYDSDSTINNPRYKYLGDKKGNCTLQITDIQKRDDATFRFGMEADDIRGHFTGTSGVDVTIIDGTQMKISSSSGDRKVRGGGNVTLFCSAFCTFHHLEVTWFKDNQNLSESGPALKLSPLTAKDSGNYTCGLKTNSRTRSLPYSLHVDEEDVERDSPPPGSVTEVSLIVGVVFGVLLVLFTLIMVLCFIRRRQAEAADHRAAVDDDVEQKQADTIYSNILPPAQTRGHQQETSPAAEEVSYASVQFKHKNPAGRRAEEAEDAAIIYSAVASRG